MTHPAPENLESDPRFPSGPWTGYYLYREIPGRHRMHIRLTFADGILSAEGRDDIGEFTFRGRYDVADGRCRWTKHYLGGHNVFYQGFNEGKGIWGVWEIAPGFKGGFHIWPEGMADAEADHLAEQAEEPAGDRIDVREFEPAVLRGSTSLS